jgi:hypothetical protein
MMPPPREGKIVMTTAARKKCSMLWNRPLHPAAIITRKSSGKSFAKAIALKIQAKPKGEKHETID